MGVSGLVIAARVTGMLLALAWVILITRNIDVNHVGQLIFGISLSNLLAIFVSLNMGAVAIKFIPSYNASDKTNYVRGYLNAANYLVIIIAVVITVLVAGFYFWEQRISSEIIPIYILISLLSAPLLGWIQLQANYMRAFEKILLSVVPTFLLQPIIMLILIWVGLEMDLLARADQLMLVYFTTLLIVFFAQYIMFQSTLSSRTNDKANYSELKSWLIQSLQLIVPLLFLQNAAQTIVVLSGGVLTEEEIAVSGVILRIMSLLLFSVGSITMATSPKLSREVHLKNDAAVTHTLVISSLIKALIVLLGFLSIFWFGEFILRFFGDQYIVGHTALLILTFVPIVTAVFGPVVLFVNLLNLHLYSLGVFIITMILLAILILVLGKTYGVEGQAYAVLIAWIFWNTCLYTIVRIKGSYDISIFNLFSR